MANRFEREMGAAINYGAPMGSCSRQSHYPERAARREGRTKDQLARKPYFACGEAARRGWMVMAWGNPYMRRVVRERIEASRAEGLRPIP